MRPFAFAFSAVLLPMSVLACACACAACGSLERSAARDPMKCERDPACAKTRSKNRDCTTQCNDDPACMDRCREMSGDTGVGHK